MSLEALTLLLDSSMLIAYERDLTRRAQAAVMEGALDGRLLIAPAVSLAVACADLGTRTRELTWLVYDPEGPLSILPMGLNALEIGSASAASTLADLEVAAVVHETNATSAVVLTYSPSLYAGHDIDVLDMRP